MTDTGIGARNLLAQATAAHQAGRVEDAERLYQAVLDAQPDHFDALHLLGILAAQSGRYDAAERLLVEALRVKPDSAPAHLNRGNVLRGLTRLDEALASYDQALAVDPGLAEALNNRGVILKKLGRLAEALSSYERALALMPGYAEALNNRGVALKDLKRPREALDSFDQALRFKSDDAEVLCNRGVALKELGRLEEALASYDKALAIRTRYADAWSNRGNVLQAMNRHGDALASYDQALAIKPDDPQVLNLRGFALHELRRLDEALASYDRALTIWPDSAEILTNRGKTLGRLRRLDEALESYNRALAIKPNVVQAKANRFWVLQVGLQDVAQIVRAGADSAADFVATPNAAPPAISAFRLEHDLEQSSYLQAHGYDFDWLRQAHAAMAGLSVRLGNGPARGATVPLSTAEAAATARFQKALLLAEAPGDLTHYLNPDNDWAAIEERYVRKRPEIVVIDDLLSGEALAALRKFCLVSTVWKTEYAGGYLGAFSSEGFIGLLHLKIALELKAKLPRIFGGHGLEQLWAFKYSPRLDKGINIHADFAQVNLNFWITPDAALLDSETGGLKVYDVPSPPDWPFQDYNLDGRAPQIYEFLAKSRANCITVPYRCNRAVLFNSTLFHETDEIHFKPGYENRRINVTYLFGRGLPR